MEPDQAETWRRALLRFRSEKDRFLSASPESPFVRSGLRFDGLKYFDHDPGFHFYAVLLRYPSETSVVMAASDGARQLYNRVGRFDLEVGGEAVKLQAYQSAEREDRSLFMPFRDATSGKETYGAGRYLELEVTHDDRYIVDFNYAYSPYCAYDEGYTCPLPPQENWLKVSIRAGEKSYRE